MLQYCVAGCPAARIHGHVCLLFPSGKQTGVGGFRLNRAKQVGEAEIASNLSHKHISKPPRGCGNRPPRCHVFVCGLTNITGSSQDPDSPNAMTSRSPLTDPLRCIWRWCARFACVPTTEWSYSPLSVLPRRPKGLIPGPAPQTETALPDNPVRHQSVLAAASRANTPNAILAHSHAALSYPVHGPAPRLDPRRASTSVRVSTLARRRWLPILESALHYSEQPPYSDAVFCRLPDPCLDDVTKADGCYQRAIKHVGTELLKRKHTMAREPQGLLLRRIITDRV